MKKKVNKELKVTKGFFKGFKDFITKGNIIDLAIGVIIGGAFGKIVSSLVSDVIMPPIGVLIGNVDFKDLKIILVAAELDALGAIITPAVTINYGMFIMTVLEFLIIAFAIYFVLTLFIRRNEFKAKLEAEEKARLEALEPEEEVVPEPSEEVLLLREIRDSLKNEKVK